MRVLLYLALTCSVHALQDAHQVKGDGTLTASQSIVENELKVAFSRRRPGRVHQGPVLGCRGLVKRHQVQGHCGRPQNQGRLRRRGRRRRVDGYAPASLAPAHAFTDSYLAGLTSTALSRVSDESRRWRMSSTGLHDLRAIAASDLTG